MKQQICVLLLVSVIFVSGQSSQYTVMRMGMSCNSLSLSTYYRAQTCVQMKATDPYSYSIKSCQSNSDPNQDVISEYSYCDDTCNPSDCGGRTNYLLHSCNKTQDAFLGFYTCNSTVPTPAKGQTTVQRFYNSQNCGKPDAWDELDIFQANACVGISGGQNPNYVTCTSSHTYIYACKDFGCSQCSVQTTLENNKCIVDDDGNVEYYSCVTK